MLEDVWLSLLILYSSGLLSKNIMTTEIWKLTNKKDLNELLCLQTAVNRISWLHEDISNRGQAHDVYKARSSSRNRALRG